MKKTLVAIILVIAACAQLAIGAFAFDEFRVNFKNITTFEGKVNCNTVDPTHSDDGMVLTINDWTDRHPLFWFGIGADNYLCPDKLNASEYKYMKIRYKKDAGTDSKLAFFYGLYDGTAHPGPNFDGNWLVYLPITSNGQWQEEIFDLYTLTGGVWANYVSAIRIDSEPDTAADQIAAKIGKTFTIDYIAFYKTPEEAKANGEYYLTKAPTATAAGTYNQRAYYINDLSQKIVLEEKVFEEDQGISFADWYLRTMVQYKSAENKYDIRFVSMLNGDCLEGTDLPEYDHAGFSIKIDGQDAGTVTTNEANTSFLANGKEINIKDYSREGDYFFLANTEIAKEIVTEKSVITVVPFVELANGSTVNGETVTFTIGQLAGK